MRGLRGRGGSVALKVVEARGRDTDGTRPRDMRHVRVLAGVGVKTPEGMLALSSSVRDDRFVKNRRQRRLDAIDPTAGAATTVRFQSPYR